MAQVTAGAIGRRCPGALALVVLLAALVPLPVAAATRRAAARIDEARPDAALYREAVGKLEALKASRARGKQPAEWEKVVLRFRRVVARYPQSGYADDALLAVGDIYREMGRRFRDRRYGRDAVKAYRAVVSEYPRSRHGEAALFHCFALARQRGDRGEMADAAGAYLDAYPRGGRAAEVRTQLRRRAPVEEAALPTPPPPGLARVFNVRTWTGEAYTRVAIDLERRVQLSKDRIEAPDRIWIDLHGARLHQALTERMFRVGDGLLKQIRLAQNRDNVVRVVLELGEVKDYSTFYLDNPLRLIVDIRGKPGAAVASTGASPSSDDPGVAASTPRAATDDDAPPTWDGPGDPPTVASPPPSPRPSVASTAIGKAPVKPTPAASPARAPAPTPTPLPPALVASGWVQPTLKRRPPAVSVPEPAPPRGAPVAKNPALSARPLPTVAGPAVPGPRIGAEPMTPGLPQANRAGSYSLARQLGLRARTIVIDAGHGGHDPGSIGPGGLQEKELVLDVAHRLDRLLRTRLGAEVIMTRPSDVFVPLEERTAIANSKGADLFLSVHANSSRNARSRGIETYFLNFARNHHAEAVAARENAISKATLKDLQHLVKAIALNSKIDESRDFAASVQEAMVAGLKAGYPELVDRGVHTAPFYVLIGANMPSVLAEISFVSNPAEEKLLKTSEHRERIAQSLFEGVRAYLEALNRWPARQLTGRTQPSTVASRGARR